MKHIMPLLIKYLMIAVVLVTVLGLMTDVEFGNILLISLVVTVLAYIIGDLLILPRTNNTVATISDAVLSFLSIYMFNWFGFGSIDAIDVVVCTLLIGVFEWFFHKYLVNRDLVKSRSGTEHGALT